MGNVRKPIVKMIDYHILSCFLHVECMNNQRYTELLKNKLLEIGKWLGWSSNAYAACIAGF